MSDLKLLLLGSSHLERSGMPVKIETRKAQALLFYLSVTKQRFSRDTLATLFWPETNQSQARTYLRRALWLGARNPATTGSRSRALGQSCCIHQPLSAVSASSPLPGTWLTSSRMPSGSSNSTE